MRLIVALILMLPTLLAAQSRDVAPHELMLNVSVEDTGVTPFEREMVLLTIRGIYRRHITLETLEQPDLEGFSWAQLGPDDWREERLDGKKVKVFERRMAIYPDRAGTLTIGAFRHKLTLTDEGDDWFEHVITSAPIQIAVQKAPAGDTWWFPTRSLQVSDQWSNAPDQLKPGEGVLRVVRLEALGVTPEMIPPMPDLTSPSAMIFPHPEKRLVELTPEGPVTYAFWRWTIRPSNDTSTIVEPMTFPYFDTRLREAREVSISAQRVAYGAVTPEPLAQYGAPPEPARLPAFFPAGLVAVLVFAAGSVGGLWGRSYAGLKRWPLFDPLLRALRHAARKGDSAAVRRAASAVLRRDGPSQTRQEILRHLDESLFDPSAPSRDLSALTKAFARAVTPVRPQSSPNGMGRRPGD